MRTTGRGGLVLAVAAVLLAGAPGLHAVDDAWAVAPRDHDGPRPHVVRPAPPPRPARPPDLRPPDLRPPDAWPMPPVLPTPPLAVPMPRPQAPTPPPVPIPHAQPEPPVGLVR